MLKKARKARLLAIKKRYHEGDGRATKKFILDEFCEVCGNVKK